jgi:hypothetical protein
VKLTAWLARVVSRRIENVPRFRHEIDRRKRMIQVCIEAEKAAYCSLDDLEAKAMLVRHLNTDSASIDGALAILARRSGYISNRALRLLSAVDSDSPMASVPQDRAKLFAQEKRLGEMPLKEAFSRLAELEPHLLDVERQISNVPVREVDRASSLPSQVNQSLIKLVGFGAGADDALLCTDLAASIVRQYLEILRGVTVLGSVDTPYFDAPLKVGIRTSRANR